MRKKASLHWTGAGQAGKGEISTETGQVDKVPYGFATRFGDDKKGSNPEELLAAAHAACFAMAFSFASKAAGFDTETVDTQADVRLVKDGEGFKIDRSALTLRAKVPGLDPAKFEELARTAEKSCPVSRLLNAEITLDAKLES